MTSSFNPPSIDRLAEVDAADCEYNEDCVEIQGVVSPSSQGGWSAAADYEVHSFSAWRRVGQPLVRRMLTILRPVAPGEERFSAFPACSIHRIRVLLSKDEMRAIFANASQLDAEDAELRAVAEELQESVVISTSRFGDLTLDRSIGWFKGNVEWSGQQIEVSFDTDNDRDISTAIRTAEALWGAQADWKHRIDDFAVQRLLPLKNENWLDEDEMPFTAEQFKARMTLESILIFSDGSFVFWHNDGDLFWGHTIQISGSLEDGLTDAEIPG